MKKNLENGVTSKTNNAPALGDRGRYKKKITCLSIYLVILLLGLFGNSSIAYGKNSNSYYVHEVLKYYNAYNNYLSMNDSNSFNRTEFENIINSYNGVYIYYGETTNKNLYIRAINYIGETTYNKPNIGFRISLSGNLAGYIRNESGNVGSGNTMLPNFNTNSYQFMIGPLYSGTRNNKIITDNYNRNI